MEFSTLVTFLRSNLSLSEEFGYFCSRKMVFEKSICWILGVGGFQFMLILDLYGMPFYVAVVFTYLGLWHFIQN